MEDTGLSLSNGFDPNKKEDGSLPDGDYVVTILTATKKETKAGGAFYLALDLRIDGPKYAGKHFFENLNLWHHDSSVAERAARRKDELLHAMGFTTVSTLQQLNGRQVVMKIKEYKGEPKIQCFKPLSAAASAQPTTAAQPAAKKAPAWAQPKGDSEY